MLMAIYFNSDFLKILKELEISKTLLKQDVVILYVELLELHVALNGCDVLDLVQLQVEFIQLQERFQAFYNTNLIVGPFLNKNTG